MRVGIGMKDLMKGCFFLGLVGENKRDVMEGSNVLIMICKLLNSIEILKSMEIFMEYLYLTTEIFYFRSNISC